MAPTRASGSANPPTACVFAIPVNSDNGTEVVFRLDVVIEVVIELELEDVVVGGEVEDGEIEGEAEDGEVDDGEAEDGEVEVGGVEVGEVEVGVEAGGGLVAMVAVAPHSSRVASSGQQPALVQ